ncbi:hypothetical protein FRACYDRAFT_240270 [Fragilariopsis cylindrus CCMP1102]|uniref:Uncharacterized protein n=1 Tax=Fragilariopsis cylindrus CCMP1102 TaxID=635003 RepID=A0A1E7FBP0_9STRA|nr:hypothetical protein FRACYDRAFT_240270 [Fragilariopsis cylindrus CCMP1102]|eukprot:OEU15577.1 hypothetical protein FRACYDRAFT_240270 [Fragilariopsis cylindrus CCMP1102]
MLNETEEAIDLTDITRNNDSQPTLISITQARREISRQLQTRVCADPQTQDHGHSYIVWNNSDWLKKKGVSSQIIPPTNPGIYGGNTHQLLEIHKTANMAWRRYKLAQAATKKMIMHAFKDYHFLELQDDNGDIVGYTAIELFDHLMDQYVQPEDVADQVTALHKVLEQEYDPTEAPQVYYKAVQDARNALDSLNQTVDDETLIRHGLNQFKEHIDLKLDVRSWKLLSRAEKTWKRFKTHFIKAINDNKNDTGTLKAIGMANAVKHQIEQGKENHEVLAQASFEAREKISTLERNYTALMAAKQPPPPPQETADDRLNQIKVLTERLNLLESNKSGGGGSGGRNGGYRSLGSNSFPKNNKDGTRACRRWSNDEYCWTCGFDIKHNSMTCKYIKDEAAHKKEATATNTMGGSTRNLHLRV